MQRADRVMRARKESICPACHAPVGVGVLIGRVGGRWLHVDPCIIGPRDTIWPAA